MTFQWPEMLWMLAAAPLLILVYVWVLRRKRKAALRYANLALVKEAMGTWPAVRRHIPPVLMLLALIAMVIAIARPSAVVTLPSQQETVILAMDVSGSMRATDIQPNRLVASQVAAKGFIADMPPKTRIGIVSFAGTASVVAPPTSNREDLYAAIDRFQLQRATAIGSGIIVSLATIFPEAGIDISALIGPSTGPVDVRGKPPAAKKKPQATDPAKPPPVQPGSYSSAVIILLTDGQRTTGPDSIEAARMAAARGVRIFTVGMGTTQGEIIGFEGWSMRVRLDEETLKSIAEITRGEYFYAGTALDLKKVYEALSTRLVMERKHSEVGALFTAAAAALALLAALLSLLWFSRIF
jgi:Ca-activated chloride channel family protein